MGTVLQESQNELVSSERTKTKAVGHKSKKSTKAPLHPPLNCGILPPAGPDSQQRLRRTRPDTLLIMTNPNRQHNPKIKSHTTSKSGQKERRQRQKSNGAKESGGRAKGSQPVKAQRGDSSDCRADDEGSTLQSRAGEEDSGSDLSDSERYSVLPTRIAPPDLNLRAEVIDPSDLRPSKPAYRGRDKSSYPDFLPPPFNSWSLRQLAVYLNTDGKAIPRPKPIGQLERYLDRLLQMEWHQIQTFQEDGSKPNASIPKSRHSASHLSLSSPKCILQCQRAFPLALLSCLTSAPTLQLSGCTCPHCKNQFPIFNGSCRSYSYHHHTRLNPLLEKFGHASALPKRSSSESRAHPSEPKLRTREHRLSDPLSESRHLRRMQAVGNIRNPAGSTFNPEQVSTKARTTGDDDVERRRPGQRSRSCVASREVSCSARGRSEERKTFDKAHPDSILSCAVRSDGLQGSKVAGRLTRKQKRVEFVTN